MKTEKQIAASAAEFSERWRGRGYERGESQPFWLDLLSNVFGIETPTDGFIRFEEHRMVDESNFVDGRIPSTRVLIEQKSLGKDLRAPIRQSDGALLNPFQQARRYVVSLPVSEHPRWIVTCNFSEFLVYDMEQPNGEPEQILLEDLGREYYRLMFLVDVKNEQLVLYWLESVIAISVDAIPEVPMFDTDTLEGCELQYKALDVRHQLLRRIGIEDPRMDEKQELCDKINKLLLTDKRNFRKRCRLCGRTLPADYRFGICEQCFRRHRRGRSSGGNQGRRRDSDRGRRR